MITTCFGCGAPLTFDQSGVAECSFCRGRWVSQDAKPLQAPAMPAVAILEEPRSDRSALIMIAISGILFAGIAVASLGERTLPPSEPERLVEPRAEEAIVEEVVVEHPATTSLFGIQEALQLR